jgi:hypothetical protein
MLEQSCVVWANVPSTLLLSLLQLQDNFELGSLFDCPGSLGNSLPGNGTSLSFQNAQTYKKTSKLLLLQAKRIKYTVQFQ